MRVNLDSDEVKQACIEFVQKMHPDRQVVAPDYFYYQEVSLDVKDKDWKPEQRLQATHPPVIAEVAPTVGAPDIEDIDIPL